MVDIWNLRYIEEALVARLNSRASLLALVGDGIRPEGSGPELFPAVNYLIADTPDGRRHVLDVYLYVDTQDTETVDGSLSGENLSRDIVAELEAALNHHPQDEKSAALLDLSSYGYRCVRQEKAFDPGPIFQGGDQRAWRDPTRWSLIVIDES